MLDDNEVFVDTGGVCLPPFCSDTRLAGDKTDQAHTLCDPWKTFAASREGGRERKRETEGDKEREGA